MPKSSKPSIESVARYVRMMTGTAWCSACGLNHAPRDPFCRADALRHELCIGGGRYCPTTPPTPPLEQSAAPIANRCWCGGEDGEHEAEAHAEEGRW